MGNCIGKSHEKEKKELSPELVKKVLEVFGKIDVDGSKTIDKEETLKFWRSNFAKLNTEALYKAVDIDNNGEISEDEWLEFWQTVKKSGHTEQEIHEELDNLIEGGAWVYFDKVPTDIVKAKRNSGMGGGIGVVNSNVGSKRNSTKNY